LYKVSGVPFELMAQAIKEVTPFLEKVIPYTGGRYKVEDIVQALLKEQMKLWVAFSSLDQKICGAIVTEINQYPQKKYFTILFCGGEKINEWDDQMHRLLENVARKNKCDAIDISGRKGWIRYMKSYGYNEDHKYIEKDLSNG
jgi:hypothetical protein